MGNFISSLLFSNNDTTISYDYDGYSKEELMKFIRQIERKNLLIDNHFQEIMNDIELENSELVPMCVELMQKILAKCDEINNENDGKRKIKKKFYVRPQFEESAIEKQFQEGTKVLEEHDKFDSNCLNFTEVSEPRFKFDDSEITLDEYNSSFPDVVSKKDMMGLTKKILLSLPDYHKRRLINAFNKIVQQEESVDKNAFGACTFIYKEAKNGPRNDINSFRKIITIPNIINHFHRAYALRMTKYFRENNYLDTTIQKGGLSGESAPVMQQIVKVKSVIKDVLQKNKKCCILYLDISDAFGSINRDAVFAI